MARTHLDEAIRLARHSGEADDLLSLALADLARVHEALDDVIEARHHLVASLKLARQQELATLWPQRWETLVRFARRLEVLTH